MFDAMVAFADVVDELLVSMGERTAPAEGWSMILDGFEAADGWFIVQVGREHEFVSARQLDRASGVDRRRPRFATRAGWREHIDVIREGVGGMGGRQDERRGVPDRWRPRASPPAPCLDADR